MKLATLTEASSSIHSRLLFIQSALLDSVDDPDLNVKLEGDEVHIEYKDLIDKAYKGLNDSNPLDNEQWLHCPGSTTDVRLTNVIATVNSAIKLIHVFPEKFKRVNLKSTEVQLGLKENKTIITCIDEDRYEIITASHLLTKRNRRFIFTFDRTVDLITKHMSPLAEATEHEQTALNRLLLVQQRLIDELPDEFDVKLKHVQNVQGSFIDGEIAVAVSGPSSKKFRKNLRTDIPLYVYVTKSNRFVYVYWFYNKPSSTHITMRFEQLEQMISSIVDLFTR